MKLSKMTAVLCFEGLTTDMDIQMYYDVLLYYLLSSDKPLVICNHMGYTLQT